MPVKKRMTENHTKRLRVLGSAVALIVIALGGRSAAAANSPHHAFHNNADFGGFCCAVLPGANAAPRTVIIVHPQPVPPPLPRHTADQHFTSETQNDVEIVRGPPSLR